MQKYKTWVEINSKAIAHNIKQIKSLLTPKTQLWSVVKSNAYGHGLTTFSKIATQLGINGFCVDSVPEGRKLRENGIKKPILVLGPSLPFYLESAAKNGLTITVSNWDALKALTASKWKPAFHLKIDSGMHRQGFYNSDLRPVTQLIKQRGLNLIGAYTHFASAKDINYPTYTENQFASFQKALNLLERSGFKNILCHAAATGGTLVNPKYQLDMVRIGIGLYGLWPSKELTIQRPELKFKPALSWHTVISEIKKLKAGDFVGYDLVERVQKPTKMAILPIGYWHGFPRTLSGVGEVLINGKKAKVLGRVSMDLVVIDAGNISCKVGDKATIIGRQKGEGLSAFDVAQKMGTIHYELITRINPLIERVVT
ncbi:MAG: alanine racemase [Candidatus Harrisonbacteria bacterium]|nr:alanine racemase [Candidatus Harrisonbacteria bacterium]